MLLAGVMSGKSIDLVAIGKSIWKDYQKTSTTQSKVIDAYLLYVLATAIVQVREQH